MESLGKIERLWRYPVKSLLGTELKIDRRGVKGDQLFAIRDNQGKFGSGKNTRRFRKIGGLFKLAAKYDESVPVISFPDGQVIRGDDPTIDKKLSAVLGQPVTLVAEKQISHFDAGALHLVTTASLQWLKSLLPQSIIDERRFRPNLLVNIPGKGLIEHGWIHKKFLIGQELEIKIIGLTERCIMTNFQQQQLPNDTKILETISKNSQHNFGVYAQVIKTGVVRVGDTIYCL